MTMTLDDRPDTGLDADPVVFAVYGTLRSGQGNDDLWRPHADSLGLADVLGFNLWAVHHGFPYALPAPDATHQIVVELIQPHPGKVDDLMHRLDRLEGTPHHYERWQVVALPVERADDGTRTWLHAFMYVASPSTAQHVRAGGKVIESGDWIAFKNGGK